MEKLRLRSSSTVIPSRISAQNKRGFTLIEVLVALAILAIALLAVTRAVSFAVKDSVDIREKTLAHWVTGDIATKVQTGLINVQAYSGTQSGLETVLNSSFYWQISSVNVTDIPALQVTVRVYDSKQQRQFNHLTLFMPIVELLR